MNLLLICTCIHSNDLLSTTPDFFQIIIEIEIPNVYLILVYLHG